jgi:hypothetical protein
VRENKEYITRLSAETGRLFKQAYRLLATARMYLEALESYENLEGILEQSSWDGLALRLIEEIMSGKNTEKLPGRVRRLFASAISPGGTVNFLDTLVGNLNKVYILQGDNGIAKGNVLERVADAAFMRGFYIEAYHCALDPYRIDHLIIPERGAAIINSMEPHCFTCLNAWQEIDTAEFAYELPQSLQEEKQLFRQRYQIALNEAVSFLAKAKSAHDELEKLYIHNIDFVGIDRLRQEILECVVDQTSNKK